MKITIFGLTISSSWGNGHATPYRALLRGLARLGHRVTFYEKDVEWYYWRRDFVSCDYCDLILYESWPEIRKSALAEMSSSDAVIVGSYCPEGAQISDEVLALERPVHVFYDLDTPITLAQLKRGDLTYLRRDQMSAFDLYLSFTGGETLSLLEKTMGVRQAKALYGCVDPEIHARVSARSEFACDLSYMGTFAADRQSKLEELFLTPAQLLPTTTFVLAGTMYPKGTNWPANLHHFDHVAPKDHPALYSSSRATLNITRDGMARGGYCPSGRFFEAAACGTPILSDWFKGLDTFFRNGEEVYVVNSAEEVLSALQRTDQELTRVATRARERTLTEHTGDARAKELVLYLGQARHRTEGPATHTGTRMDMEVAS